MTSSISSKEAVVFLLDASPSMNAPYPSNGPTLAADTTSTSTRLSCAKSALEDMLAQLMIQSKQNEVGVIVLKTRETRHHLHIKHEEEEEAEPAPVPFSNITELTEGGITIPTVDLIRQIRSVEAVSAQEGRRLRGDFCDGIVVAADALYRRTHGKIYQRRLVLLTDAAHEVKIDMDQVLSVVDSLREMECTLTVIGLDFEHSADFEHAADESDATKVGIDNGTEDSESASDGDSDSDSETTVGDEQQEGARLQLVKRDNELLLVSLAKLTGGSVIAASTMQEMADSRLGKRIPKSTKRKMEFHVAPGFTFEARFSLLLSKANMPSLKREAIVLDEYSRPLKNGMGQIMTSAVQAITDHWDADNQDIDVGLDSRASAYKYGADLIPIGTFDVEGLKFRSQVCMRIIGYTDQKSIARALLVGPPYAISGHDSQRACGTIAALAEALHRLRQTALCLFVKSKDADPILGTIFPLEEVADVTPRRLVFMQLPFAGDVRNPKMTLFDEWMGDRAKAVVCDELVDSLMLPMDALRSDQIANSAIRSFQKTIKNRAVQFSHDIVTTRNNDPVDPMATPPDVLDRAVSALKSFRELFPLDKLDEDSGKATKKTRHWSDYD